MDSLSPSPTIYETPHWNLVLNKDQMYLGRAVILLKRPCGDLAEVTDEEMLDFFALLKRSEHVYRAVLGVTMFNWSCLMNNAYLETPPKPFVHWHLVPRYGHAVHFAGREFRDPNFGHRSISDEAHLSADEFKRLSEALTEGFANA